MGLWIYNSSVLLLLDSASSRGKALRIQTLRRFLGRCIQQLSTWIWFIVELGTSSPIFLLLPMAIVAERLDECAGRRTKMVCSLSALDVSPLRKREQVRFACLRYQTRLSKLCLDRLTIGAWRFEECCHVMEHSIRLHLLLVCLS